MEENSKTVSFEFFPPKTDSGKVKLISTSKAFEEMSADHFSVTFGAGGSTKRGTLETCVELYNSTKTSIVPHISGIGSTKEDIKCMLDEYIELGFKKLMVLRGDLPSGFGSTGDFSYAIDLIKFIKENYENYFYIGVGAYPEVHPEALNAEEDLNHFVEKVKAGANNAVTQFFYEPSSYIEFVNKCIKKGITTEITPGIMPITNKNSLIRMCKGCGAKLPKSLVSKLSEFDDEEELNKFGTDYVAGLCEKLLDNGAPGLHFYTINQLEPTKKIVGSLNLDS
tara:strand:+ start:348 stop:1190 length:843 start_codon:yes stop_codon:yes gene_type:complete